MMLVIYCLLFPIFFRFSAGKNEMEYLCEPNKVPCSFNACYDPLTQICHKVREGRTICRKEEQLCVLGEYSRVGQCYNSSTHVCLRDKDYVWNGIVCRKNEQMCGGYKCYDPTIQDCHGHIICNKNEQLCNGECYDPKLQQCSAKKLCNIEDKACNGICYPSTLNQNCFRLKYNEDLYKEINNYTKLW